MIVTDVADWFKSGDLPLVTAARAWLDLTQARLLCLNRERRRGA